MNKYSLVLGAQQYYLEVSLNGKKIKSFERYTGAHYKVHKVPTELTYLNLDLLLQYLSSQTEGKNLMAPLKELFQFCAATAPVSNYSTQQVRLSNSNALTSSFSATQLEKQLQSYLDPAAQIKKTTSEFDGKKVNEIYENIYECLTLRFLEPAFLSNTLKIELLPLESDVNTLSMSGAKEGKKMLVSYKKAQPQEMIKKIITQLEMLEKNSLDEKVVLNIRSNVVSSKASYALTTTTKAMNALALRFAHGLAAYVDKIVAAAPKVKEEVKIEEFKGIFAKTENVDKNKSYMYLVSTPRGEVGFLGIAITPVKSSREYASQYALKVVQSMAGALLFHTADYLKSGLGELRNKNYYSSVEAVECSQIFRMKDTAFKDNKIQAFAAALQKAYLEEQMEEFTKASPIETNKTAAPQEAVAMKKRHKI